VLFLTLDFNHPLINFSLLSGEVLWLPCQNAFIKERDYGWCAFPYMNPGKHNVLPPRLFLIKLVIRRIGVFYFLVLIWQWIF
jgi:hypothetical protein